MRMTGLSGNEIFCLHSKGWAPGDIVVGNSVHSLGVVRSITGGLKALAGGEIQALTSLISDGRHAAITRIEQEAIAHGAQGLTGVTSQLRSLGGLVEFLAIGSAVSSMNYQGPFFSTACSGQDFYCHLDAGYQPRHFVMGNVCYAMGVGRGLAGTLRQITSRGEVPEFSQMYNHTRHLALERLEQDAASRGCNAVVDIETRIMPFGPGVREMLMVGTGSYNAALGNQPRPVTSELTGEELWNLTRMGCMPLRLVLGTSVYALGLAGGIRTFFRSLGRGEIDDMTRLIYEARENCLAHLREDAQRHNADAVIGIRVHVYELGGGLVEVLAIGTAIKNNPAVRTEGQQLLQQVMMHDRETFFDDSLRGLPHGGVSPAANPGARPAGSVVALIFLSLFLCGPLMMFVIFLIMAAIGAIGGAGN